MPTVSKLLSFPYGDNSVGSALRDITLVLDLEYIPRLTKH